MTRIALTALPDDDGQAPRPAQNLGHCHLPQATPDCPTCVEVYGADWAARQLQQRAAAARLADLRVAARTAAATRTRRGLASEHASDDNTGAAGAGSGWCSGWDTAGAVDRGRDDGWGDSA